MAVVPFKNLENQVADLLNSKLLSSAAGVPDLKLSSSARGLAILIGCRTSSSSNHSPLGGVEKDLSLLRDTFSGLDFDTVELFDPKKEEIEKVIRITKQKLHTRALFYDYIVVTFSGHGDQTKLFTRNGCLGLMDDIVTPLISEHPKVPKLFFVDACRGDKKDVGVSYTFGTDQQGKICARGATTEEINLPQNGNYLLAYSTLAGMKSFENDMLGSYWMRFLSYELLNNNGKSILDVLTLVNQKLILEFNKLNSTLQQPILMSCLNMVLVFQIVKSKVINLRFSEIDDEADINLESIQLLDTIGDHEEEANLDINVSVQLPRLNPDTQQGYYRGILNLFKQKGIIIGKLNENFDRDTSDVQQYCCTLIAELRNKCFVQGKSRFMPKRIAEEEAAEDLYSKIKLYIPCLRNEDLTSSASASSLRLSPMPSMTRTSTPSSSSASLPRLSPPPPTTPTASMARTNTPPSSSVLFPGLSPPPSTTPGASMSRSYTQGKTEKSILKEYCDQKWKGEKVEYDTNRDPSGNGFIATVTLPDGFTRTGSARINKKEAENSVAKLVLVELKIS